MAISSFNASVCGGHDSQLDWDAFLRHFGLESNQSELNEDFTLPTQYAAAEQLPGPYEFTAPPASSLTSHGMMTQYFAQSLGRQSIFGQLDADSSQNIYDDAYFSVPVAAEEQVPRSQRDVTALGAWSFDAIDRLSQSISQSLEAIYRQSFPDENLNISYNGDLPAAEQQLPGEHQVPDPVASSSTSRGTHVAFASPTSPVQLLTASHTAYPAAPNTPAQYIPQNAPFLPQLHMEEAASSSTAVSTRPRAPLQSTQPSNLPPALPRSPGSRPKRRKTSPRTAPYKRSQRPKRAKNESNPISSSSSFSSPSGSAASLTDLPNLSDLAFLLRGELYQAKVLPDYSASLANRGHSAGITFPMPGLAILPHCLPSQQAYEGMSRDMRPLWDAIATCHDHGLNAHTIGGVLKLLKPRQPENFRHAVGSVETCRWRGCNEQFRFQHAARSGSERESDEEMLKRVYGEMEEHIAQVHGEADTCAWVVGRGRLVDRSGWYGEGGGDGAEGTQEETQDENEIICGTSRKDSKGIKRCLWAHLRCRALCRLCNASFARDDELKRHGPICPAKSNSDDGRPTPPGPNAPSPDENRPPDALVNHSSSLNNAMIGYFSYR